MQWLIRGQATTMHQNHCNRKEVLKKADTRGVIEGFFCMVLLLAQSSFYGYFSMKGKAKQGILHPYLPFFLYF